MKIQELLEAIAPIQPISPVTPDNASTAASQLDQHISQAEQPDEEQTMPKVEPPKNMKGAIDAIRAAAGGEPVQTTKNPGLDTLLFRRAALAKGVSGVANAIGKGLKRMGSSFEKQSGGIKRIASFDREMRSGAQMRLGAGANKVGLDAVPNAPKTIAPGQTAATGIKQISPARLVPTKLSPDRKRVETIGDLDAAILSAAGNDPIGLSQNAGVDQLISAAIETQKILINQQEVQQP